MLDLDMNLVMIAEDQETYKKYAQDSSVNVMFFDMVDVSTYTCMYV